MIVEKKPKHFWTVLIVFTLAFIWGNSLMPPSVSWFISNLVQQFLALFTPVSSPDSSGAGFWGVLVRKAAHFTEFFVLGGLLSVKLSGGGKKPWPAMLAAVLAALADETIQYYTGRTSSVFDVWLDLSGAAVGILAALWFLQRKGRGSPGKKRGALTKDGEGNEVPGKTP